MPINDRLALEACDVAVTELERMRITVAALQRVLREALPLLERTYTVTTEQGSQITHPTVLAVRKALGIES